MDDSNLLRIFSEEKDYALETRKTMDTQAAGANLNYNIHEYAILQTASWYNMSVIFIALRRYIYNTEIQGFGDDFLVILKYISCFYFQKSFNNLYLYRMYRTLISF